MKLVGVALLGWFEHIFDLSEYLIFSFDTAPGCISWLILTYYTPKCACFRPQMCVLRVLTRLTRTCWETKIKIVATRRQILRLKCIKFDFGWCSGGRILKNAQVENVAIANALQLEAARRCAVRIRFNFTAHVKFEVAQPIRCRLIAFLLLIRYGTLVVITYCVDYGTSCINSVAV